MLDHSTTITDNKDLAKPFRSSGRSILPHKLFGLTNGKLRSFLKAVSYRFLGSLTTVGISFILTKQTDLSLSIGALDLVGKIGLYYFHERVWDKIS